MSTLDHSKIDTMTAPMLRLAVKEHLKVDPMSLDKGDPVAMKAALHKKFDPKPAGKAAPSKKGAAAAAAATTPSTEPAKPTPAAAKGDNDPDLAGLRVLVRDILKRVDNLELQLGQKEMSAPSVPTNDQFSLLSDYVTIAQDGEPEMHMEVSDIDVLSEPQVEQLAMLLKGHLSPYPFEPNLSVRVKKHRLKQALSKVLGDSTTAVTATTPPAGKAPAKQPSAPAPTAAWKPGDLVVAQIDGEVHNPVRLIVQKGKKWIAHLPDNTLEEELMPDKIRGKSDKPWKLDELEESDLE